MQAGLRTRPGKRRLQKRAGARRSDVGPSFTGGNAVSSSLLTESDGKELGEVVMPGFTTRPEIRGTFGVVASTHWLASAIGMSILEKGGNAFDAAAAAGFTLQVVEPSTNGPLGEAPMLVWSEANRRCDMICGQGVAPGAA